MKLYLSALILVTLVAYAVVGCVYNGVSYEVGESFRTRCYVCECTGAGFFDCTRIDNCGICAIGEPVGSCGGFRSGPPPSCPAGYFCSTEHRAPDPPIADVKGQCCKVGCVYNDVTYEVGDTFNTRCYHCVCTATGYFDCTKFENCSICAVGEPDGDCGGFGTEPPTPCKVGYFCSTEHSPPVPPIADLTGKCCRDTTICAEPVEEGSCDENKYRFYYDISRHKCRKFRPRGTVCGVGNNKFKKKRDCKRTCLRT